MNESDYTNDIDALTQWVGRTRQSTEVIAADHASKLANTLDRSPLSDGDVLPALWHFAFHLTSVPVSELGADGHPVRGEFLPPVALPRRMWAGGRLEFLGDVHIGDTVTKTSTIQDVQAKTGSSGELRFVTVRHELAVGSEVRIVEEQDLVFRDHPAANAPSTASKHALQNADFTNQVTPSEVLLFRYSALTFNAHRIHYDRMYAQEVEGYDDLVVHGPLTATLLADLAVTTCGEPLATFSFRGVAPLYVNAPITIAGVGNGRDIALWAAAPDGRLAMTASATLRDN